MDHFELDTVRGDLETFFERARGEWWMQMADSAASDDRWETALERLEKLVHSLGDYELSPLAWREIVLAMLQCAVRARAIDRLADIVGGYARSGWHPGSDLPREFAQIFTLVHRLKHYEVGTRLAELVCGYYPRLAHGPYAHAHFRELRATTGSKDTAAIASSLADTYVAAGEKFAEHDEPEAAAHCRLRAGARLLLDHRDTERGRRLLRSVKSAELSREERVWYAYAMAHSPFWLDRIRAADVVDELQEAIDEDSDVDARQVLRDVTTSLFLNLPPILQPAEEDRLTSLLAGTEDPTRRAAYTANLRARAALEQVGDRALDDASLPALLRDAEPALAATAAVVGAWHDPSSCDEVHDDLASSVIHVLASAASEQARVVEGALVGLEDIMQRTLDRPSRWRPIALIWPRVLPLAGESETLDERLGVVADLYARHAPQPSYGWWELSAAMADHGLHMHAALVCRRALQDEAPGDAKCIDTCIARSIQWAIEHADDALLRWWLERGAERAGA